MTYFFQDPVTNIDTGPLFTEKIHIYGDFIHCTIVKYSIFILEIHQ
jgi:hypothetical protein